LEVIKGLIHQFKGYKTFQIQATIIAAEIKIPAKKFANIG